jgi:hypothetical protein
VLRPGSSSESGACRPITSTQTAAHLLAFDRRRPSAFRCDVEYSIGDVVVDGVRQDDLMTTWPEVPQFGALLRPHIESVPAAARPAFLAGLERSAAARYRTWAADAPEHADELLACASREDEIADLVIELFPISADDAATVSQELPAAVTLYYEVFAPYSLAEQLYLQSEAELQGAQAWIAIAGQIDDETATGVLARCTSLERESSRVVKDLLDQLGTNRKR